MPAIVPSLVSVPAACSDDLCSTRQEVIEADPDDASLQTWLKQRLERDHVTVMQLLLCQYEGLLLEFDKRTLCQHGPSEGQVASVLVTDISSIGATCFSEPVHSIDLAACIDEPGGMWNPDVQMAESEGSPLPLCHSEHSKGSFDESSLSKPDDLDEDNDDWASDSDRHGAAEPVMSSILPSVTVKADGDLVNSDEDDHQTVPMVVYASYSERFQHFMVSPKIEVSFTLLVILSSITMALDLQYQAFDIGKELDYPGSESRSEEVWPGFHSLYNGAEIGFGVLFTTEVLLKIVALQVAFFKSGWNLFDALIISFWLGNQVIPALANALNPMLLRTLRVVKMARVLRLIKWVECLDALHILIGAIKSSVSVLVWSTMLLATIVTITALIFASLLRTDIDDETLSLEVRRDFFKYFGSFTRAFVSTFELSMGNWVPICRFLSENSSQWYAFVIILYRIVIEFSVVKIITGVFLHETFKVVNDDDHLMVIQKRRHLNSHRKKMEKFFKEADDDFSGNLSLHEFKQYVKCPEVRTWLGAMDVQVHDAEEAFKLLDDSGNGDGLLSIDEIVNGVSRLRGPAKSTDMLSMWKELQLVEEMIDGLSRTIVERFPLNHTETLHSNVSAPKHKEMTTSNKSHSQSPDGLLWKLNSGANHMSEEVMHALTSWQRRHFFTSDGEGKLCLFYVSENDHKNKLGVELSGRFSVNEMPSFTLSPLEVECCDEMLKNMHEYDLILQTGIHRTNKLSTAELPVELYPFSISSKSVMKDQALLVLAAPTVESRNHWMSFLRGITVR